MGMERIAVIPAYEPVKEMIELLKGAKECGFELVVVDDGSGEAYRDIFEEARQYAEVLSYPENGGKGVALRTGFQWLTEHKTGDYHIIQMDCDGQHALKDAVRLFDALAEDPEALWLGSRVLPKDAPFRSRVGNDINRYLFGKIAGVPVYDAQTGMRAFSSALLPLMLKSSGDRYEYEMNVLLLAAKEKVPIKEIEIETIYIDKNSSSHFRPMRDSVRIYHQIFKAKKDFKN